MLKHVQVLDLHVIGIVTITRLRTNIITAKALKTEVVEYIRIVISCPIPVAVITGPVPAPLAAEEEAAAVVEAEGAVVAP